MLLKKFLCFAEARRVICQIVVTLGDTVLLCLARNVCVLWGIAKKILHSANSDVAMGCCHLQGKENESLYLLELNK